MKIGRLNISFTKKPQNLSERYKAAYDKQATSKPTRKVFHQGENSWASRCKHNDVLAEEYSIAKMAPFGLAGLVTAQGIYFKPAETKPKKEEKATLDAEKKITEQKFERYGQAEDAQYFVEKFAKNQLVNIKFYETTWRMARYGGCFWEITAEPEWGFRIAPMQEYIEPAEADEQGKIVKWRQVVNGITQAEWTSEELVLVPFLGVTTATWPYAPSIYTGLDNELEMLTGIEESAKDYSEKQAWPYELLQLGDAENPVDDAEYAQARTEWKNRKPGEGIVATVPSDIKAGGTGSAPIRELATLAELMKDNVVDSVMIPPVSKLYNSTEASSKEMNKNTMTTLGQPVQWILASYFSEYVLKPMLEASGFSRKSCPEVVFESPDVHKKEEGEYWTSLVQNKIQSPVQACDHLGLEYDEAYWKQEELKQQEQFKQQLDVKVKQAEGNPKAEGEQPKQCEGKSFKVTELFPEAHKHD